jgi:hypothetical protein
MTPSYSEEPRIKGPIYQDILQKFLEPQFFAGDLMNTVLFEQDRTPCRYANVIRRYLK